MYRVRRIRQSFKRYIIHVQIRNQYRVASKSSNFLPFDPTYWTRRFEIRNFVFKFLISDPKNLKPPSFIQNKYRPHFDPSFSILEFRTQIRNQRPQKPRSTEFDTQQVTFCIFIRYFEFSDLDFKFNATLHKDKSKKLRPCHAEHVSIPRSIPSMPTKG